MQLIKRVSRRLFSTHPAVPKHKFEIRTPFDVFSIDGSLVQTPCNSVKDTSSDLFLRSTVFHSADELLSLYKTMVYIRRMELTADALYKTKFIRGFCHLAIGQEAIPAGMEVAITSTDTVITAYRCHGAAFARGASLHSIFAELLGKKTGIARGKGGSMHIYLKNFFGGNGIVGAQVPVGAGIAFAQKYKKEQNVTFALYGDGAANQGQVFEAYNMSMLWSLPCIFVCENNMYGMGTSAERSSASVDYYSRAGFIPGIRVDAQDVLGVIEATRFAKAWALSGRGPLVLEMKTYRYQGHSVSDPGTTYRNRDEVQKMRDDHDPITLLRSRLLDANLSTEAELTKTEKTIRQEVEEAAEQAKADSDPDLSVLFEDVYLPGSDPVPPNRGTLF